MSGCPAPTGALYGQTIDKQGNYHNRHFVLDCGRWDCEYCRRRKAKRIFKRSLNGEIVEAAKQRDGFRDFNHKLLTLTCPGREFRDRYTPHQAAKMMRDALAKMLMSLRKTCGKFHYLRVTENQKDGYPHYHIVLCGAAIAPKWVLTEIQRLWSCVNEMGFVRLNWIENPVKAIKYVLKYLFKDPALYGRLRLMSYSRGAIEPPAESQESFLWYEILWAVNHFGGRMAFAEGIENIDWAYYMRGHPEFLEEEDLRCREKIARGECPF